MPKVICTLPNAATEISGVKFTPADGGVRSEDITAEQLASFLAIPGYVEHHEDADEVARLADEVAAEAQRVADEAAQKAAAAKPAPKAAAKPQKPAKAEPAAPVEPEAVAPVVADDDTTF